MKGVAIFAAPFCFLAPDRGQNRRALSQNPRSAQATFRYVKQEIF
jgi:hypothetical protein